MKKFLSAMMVILAIGAQARVQAQEVDQPESLELQLWKAVIGNDVSRVKSLLDKGADPLLPMHENYTPALFAAARDGRTEIVNLILDRGTDPRVRHQGISLLISAARGDRDGRIVRRLVDAGLDVNEEMPEARYYSSPLGIAAQAGNLEVVEILLDSGARVNNRDGSRISGRGKTVWVALRAAVERLTEENPAGKVNHGRSRTALKIIEKLIKAGANVTLYALSDVRKTLYWAQDPRQADRQYAEEARLAYELMRDTALARKAACQADARILAKGERYTVIENSKKITDDEYWEGDALKVEIEDAGCVILLPSFAILAVPFDNLGKNPQQPR
jgi:ankyrin repeat protein